MSIEERVGKVLVDGIGLEPKEIFPEANLKQDLGIDSTEMVEMIVALEREFGVKVPDGLIDSDTSIKDLVMIFSKTLTQ